MSCLGTLVPQGPHTLVIPAPQVKLFWAHNNSMGSPFRSFARCLPLALLVLLSGCATVLDEDGALAIVPYHISSTGRIIVAANINETGPFDFAVDTGASISVLLKETVERAGLRHDTANPVLVHGMVGSGRYPTAIIDRLAVGSEAWVGAKTVVMPGGTKATTGLDGILGIDFLSRYAVGYSAQEGVIRLYPPPVVAERSYRGWSSIPLRRLKTSAGPSRLFAIDIEIAGRRLPALLDLGAGANMMNTRALRFIGERLRKRHTDKELVGAVEATIVHAELEVGVVKTARLRWANTKFLVADIHALEILQLDDRPIAIIGADFFNRRDFVIDFVRSRLLVKMPN